MPKIPTYDTPQVNLNAMPTYRRDVNRPAGYYGEAIAKGLGNVAEEMFKAKEQADIIRAEEAVNKLRESQNQLGYGKDGAFNVKGANVFNREQPFQQDYVGRFDASSEQIMAELGNDNQKRLFQRAAGRLKLDFSGQLSRHEATEGFAYRESVYKGVLKTESESVATNFNDPDSVAQSIQRVTANTRMYAQSQGLAADQADMSVKEAQSAMHGIVINKILTGDTQRNIVANIPGARSYYEANRDNMTDKDRKTIEDLIIKDERNMKASTAVDAVWKGFGPGDDEEAVNLDVMAGELRAEFKDDPDGLKIAMADLKERANMHDYSVKQRQAQTVGGIWNQVLSGGSLASIRKSEEFRSLDGAAQAQMINQIENFNKRGQEGDSVEKFAEYWAVASNPQRLAKMSDAEIFALTPKIGLSMTKSLLNSKQQLIKGDDKVTAASIDQDQFNYWMGKAGFDSGNKEDKNVIGEIKYRVETMIDEQQQMLGRQLKRDEKDEIMKRLFVQVPVRVKNRWYQPGDTSVEMRPLYDVRNPESIVIQGADRETVVKALKGIGITNPTEAQIREGYIQLKK